MLREKLTTIERGMRVVDRNGQEIGNVSMICYSDEDPTQYGPETVTADNHGTPPTPNWVDEFVQGLTVDHDIPDEVINRLHRKGFIRVHKTHYFGDRDYFITIDQITNVVDDTVTLNIAQEDALNLG